MARTTVPNVLANGCCGGFVVAWVLGWTSIVLVFDAFAAGAAYRQLRAATFPTVEGVVTHCDVKTVAGSDGPSHRLDVAYEYEVGGRRHTGTRYSYAEMGTNTRAWHRVRDEMPPGTRVRVAHDPDDPAESLLRPGLTGFHLSMVWFLTPFNLIMLAGWVALARARRCAFDPTDPRTASATAAGWRVRLPTFGRATRFAVVLLAVSFSGIFVWAFGFGFNPPVPLAAWAYVAAVAVAALAATWHTPPWLEVDEMARVLRISGKPEPVEVPFDAIRDVTVAHEEKKDSDGDVTHEYHCELVRAEAPLRVATYRDRNASDALAAWLRERIGLPQPTSETSPPG